MKQYLALIGLLTLVPSLCFAGTITSMNQDEVTNAFSDKTITTVSAATLNGKIVKDSFTGYLSPDGKGNGSFETKPKNGPQSDTGTWKVDPEGRLCIKWDHWDNGKEQCVSIYKLSNGLLVINNKNGFESMILSEQIKPGNQMSILLSNQ